MCLVAMTSPVTSLPHICKRMHCSLAHCPICLSLSVVWMSRSLLLTSACPILPHSCRYMHLACGLCQRPPPPGVSVSLDTQNGLLQLLAWDGVGNHPPTTATSAKQRAVREEEEQGSEGMEGFSVSEDEDREVLAGSSDREVGVWCGKQHITVEWELQWGCHLSPLAV